MIFITRLVRLIYLRRRYRFRGRKTKWNHIYRIFMEMRAVSHSFVKLIAMVVVMVIVNCLRYIYIRVGLRMYYGVLLIMSFFLVFRGWVIWGANRLKGVLGHWLPQGIGGVLMIFIPVLELIGIIIRPLTLAVRLGTNLRCGHVILLIFRYFSFRLRGVIVIVVGVALLMLYFIELMVCFIQGYVFWRLVYIYYSEIDV